MSQACVAKVPGAPGTGRASSAAGAPAVLVSQYTGRTLTRLTSRAVTWTRMSARPGTTPGGRTTTRTGYGPARPAKYTSGLPTWADATTAHATRTTSHASRRPLI